MNRYNGQVVLVTGAGQGLGRAMAHRFAAEGATVVIAEINETTGAALAAELTDKHGVTAQAHASTSPAPRTSTTGSDRSTQTTAASTSWSTTPASSATTASRTSPTTTGTP